jgi:hypothetical protein
MRDFQLIQAFPPALRWFAKDEGRRTLPVPYTRAKCSMRRTRRKHRAHFLAACFARSTV